MSGDATEDCFSGFIFILPVLTVCEGLGGPLKVSEDTLMETL